MPAWARAARVPILHAGASFAEMNVKLTPAEQKVKVLNGADLFTVMAAVLRRSHKIDRAKEHFWVVGLAADHELLYVELISLGGHRATVVEPMDIFRWALQKDSRQLILVHNHPRGSLQPSAPDVELTAHLYQVGALLELPVVDHLIITEQAFYSFAESGLMAEIAHSRKYLLSGAAQEKLKAEARALGEKAGVAKGIKVGEAKGLKAGVVKGREQGAIAIAVALKAKGVPVGVIAEVTGLSAAKVKGLKAATKQRRPDR